ncbi:AraC-like DNA-binding protein [Rhizobium sp. BK529]|uniref:helix-turn-helix domain-containing protein n=1 Tax=unclassified Rhizobium TaxID=2613769 RepID=UPI00104B18C3|nr:MULTISPECIES: AraC family transcriptional regulator [unclassified Rhizobium]MBB3595044.1 AraC-like DNA-binding protein [Rhizobium sp. BK529]TCR98697.1 AraC family transcriptional regulator [Rhizobium sp. BK418]
MDTESEPGDDRAAGQKWPAHMERRRWPREPAMEKERRLDIAPALVPLRFSTQDLPPKDQFQAWRAHMAPLVDVHLPDEKSPDDGFLAEQIGWHVGDILIVQQRTQAHSYIRDQATLRSSPIDHWNVGLLHSGRVWTEVSRHVTEAGPGDVFFRSLGYPHRGRMIDSVAVLVFLPYELLAANASLLQGANNTLLSGSLAELLTTYMTDLETKLSNLAAGEVPRIVQTISDMVVACAVSSSRPQTGQIQTSMGMMERAHRYIHLNLHSNNLTPDIMCRALGISRTRLYQLFEANGGVSNYIRKRRLLQAYADLSNPADNRPISEIAEATGFDAAANFTRAFSHEFGSSPREIRKSAATERPAVPAARSTRIHGTTIGDWLTPAG